MNTSLTEKIAALSPERQERIRAETARIQEEYLTLQALYKAREMTQGRLAEILDESQVCLAQLETGAYTFFLV